MSAAENRKLFLAVLVILTFCSEIVRSAQVYLSSGQDVDIQCWNSLGRPYFPLLYKAGLSAGGSIQAVGPLYANQHILCQTGSNATAPSPAACNVSYAELTLAPTRVCATSASSSANFTLRCPACASALTVLPPPPAAAAEMPLCNGTQRLTGASGVFTDGAPPGGVYAPGSFCQWVIDPGYKPVRLNITRFSTEARYDYVWILRLDGNGFQDVLQQLSGAFHEVPHSITVPSDRAVVVFLSDHANQASGFAMAWDQGNYCEPHTTLLTAQGTVSDGAPTGKRYRPFTRCEWLIAPGYAPIGLTFTRFSLAANDTLSVYDGDTADPARLLALPLALTSSPGDADHLFQINSTITGALLLVFSVVDGSELGGGFSAFYGPVKAGQIGGSNWGFSKLVSAIIIVSAVVFGLACGSIVGCLLVRLYSMQQQSPLGGQRGGRSSSRRWRVRLPWISRPMRWQRQPSVAEQDVLQATGALRSAEAAEAAEEAVQQRLNSNLNTRGEVDIVVVGASGGEMAQGIETEGAGPGFARGNDSVVDAQSNPLFEVRSAFAAAGGHRPG
ncbi:hypothetical protein COCSUDRAFT_43400 [Coccomyxa subellipsoidea C-169]|uniref:CUB domain-containing protein n=1 Tax=Coccomyxa subellipsoidea (strain C-169) TaxID=574566 RepID=I0YRM0_COCSC|nr:hypothetical protein COCSUDRAFT_43400 [Coccomyxa subellipsoidea C-169]EIE21039.1 hypothetical protein COCSUDRAFT_43400 [Coccomyxa subellipsoidea C-169]|eukprot:XP_005645583.1 hypothetical protein COCSUDRAFT_43400 [Coccomyxa subellipsoidea C-169]